MPKPPKANACTEAGAHVNQAGGPKATNQNSQRPQSITDADVLASKSSATKAQLAKVLVLLRQGPKTTMELREHSIMMPAARIFSLKHEHKYVITTELLPLFDRQGIRHSKCARYHLAEQLGEQASK